MSYWQLVFTLRQKDRLISDHFAKPWEGGAAAVSDTAVTAAAAATG